jgi:NAD+ synthase
MSNTLRLALAQLNPVVGDVAGNLQLLRTARAEAAKSKADLVIASELVVAGYPPDDLVLRRAFMDHVEAAVAAFAKETADGGPGVVLGSPWREDGKLHNAALLLADGAIKAKRFKHDLPNYGVFDEKRVFAPGPLPGPADFRGVRLGLVICEDMWTPDVTECLTETGAELLVVINGSPFDDGKQDEREQLAQARVRESGLPLVYVNQVGGQDELVFDGRSFVLNADGTGAALLPPWESLIVVTDWTRSNNGWRCQEGPIVRPAPRIESIYRAMIVGLRDYVAKNRFPSVVIGLSGGIDSALTAAVAVDALGPKRVHCVSLPYRYTAQQSVDDARECARLLGIRFDLVSIEPAVESFKGMLAAMFAGRAEDVTEENLQARARGVTLMAISNKFGAMVLTTGNKSEMSVGYATLYGDMCGGFSVLKDVYKTTVYDLVEWRNRHLPEGALGPSGVVIPQAIIDRPPTAELRPGQKDQDSLPPYDKLDDILRSLVEEAMPLAAIVARGHPRETVERIARLLDVAEYKRRQAPPGVKITRRSFGRERRYPITNAFRERP